MVPYVKNTQQLVPSNYSSLIDIINVACCIIFLCYSFIDHVLSYTSQFLNKDQRACILLSLTTTRLDIRWGGAPQQFD